MYKKFKEAKQEIPKTLGNKIMIPLHLRKENKVIKEAKETTNWEAGMTEIGLLKEHTLDNIEMTEKIKNVIREIF